MFRLEPEFSLLAARSLRTTFPPPSDGQGEWCDPRRTDCIFLAYRCTLNDWRTTREKKAQKACLEDQRSKNALPHHSSWRSAGYRAQSGTPPRILPDRWQCIRHAPQSKVAAEVFACRMMRGSGIGALWDLAGFLRPACIKP